MQESNQKENNVNHLNISRTQKSIFSNPFHQKKLGLACAQTCFHRQMKRMFKQYPEKFYEIKSLELICNDEDCTPRTCHKKVLSRFLKKI